MAAIPQYIPPDRTVECRFVEPQLIHDGIRQAVNWAPHLFGSSERVADASRRLKNAALLYKWMDIGDIADRVEKGLSRAWHRFQKRKLLPAQNRMPFLSFVTTLFIEDLSMPTFEATSFAALNLKYMPESSPLYKLQPLIFALASAAAAVGAIAKIRQAFSDYTTLVLSSNPNVAAAQRNRLIIKLVKSITSLILGIIGILSLFFGATYQLIALAGGSLLYIIGIYEDMTREETPHVPKFQPSI